MEQSKPIVYVVDDDASVREGLDNLFRSIGYATHCFASVDGFVSCVRTDRPSCLILDVRMPGKSGLELQRDLQAVDDAPPIVFLTAHGDVPMSVRAMKAGAIEFLLKPFREQDLLDAVTAGIERDRARRHEGAANANLLECFRALSPRESQVLELVAKGQANKDIARALDLKEITIKVHRAKAMKKLEAGSLADFLKKIDRWERLKNPIPNS